MAPCPRGPSPKPFAAYTNLWTHPSIISLNLAFNNLTLDFQVHSTTIS